MKSIYALFFFVFSMFSGYSQMKQKASPPKEAKAIVGETTVTINYSSPFKKGRSIFGSLVPFDKVWRTGANEATTLEISSDVQIEEKTLAKGKYALFTIPGEKEWTIILNSHSEQWGAYNYDAEKDVMRFTVPTQELKESVESFTINVDEKGVVSIMWDTTKVDFTVKP